MGTETKLSTVQVVRLTGHPSVADVADAGGGDEAAVKSALAELADKGFLVEKNEGGRGRPEDVFLSGSVLRAAV